jgi:hypothetical protein
MQCDLCGGIYMVYDMGCRVNIVDRATGEVRWVILPEPLRICCLCMGPAGAGQRIEEGGKVVYRFEATRPPGPQTHTFDVEGPLAEAPYVKVELRA